MMVGGRVRMVVTDGHHKVAVRLIEIRAQDQSGRGDVVAGPFDQAAPDSGGRGVGILRDNGQPQAVNLHHPVILGSITVLDDKARPAALDPLNGRQYPRGQGVEFCHQSHALQKREVHRRSPLSRCGHARKGEEGFTLLEILVVVAILGLLIGLVAPAALRQLGGARVSVAKQSIERLSSVLDLYKLDTGSYPTTEEGLSALAERPASSVSWAGPYVRGAVPADPWSHAYTYRRPSARTGKEYDLCSPGPTGTAGAADGICNN